MDGTPLLDVRGLGVAYGAATALSDVTLQVADGETVALLGANGAGKTTLLHALSGLRAKAAGSVHFDGRDITAATPHAIVAAGLVQVPEHRLALGRMSVYENILVGAHVRKDTAKIKSEIADLLELFPALKSRLGDPAAALSGGQQQMLVLCRGLIAKPRLLMLDEPSLGLAPLLVDQVYEVLRGLRDRGQAILVVEQNARKALAISGRAYVLELGRVALEGDSASMANDPRLTHLYLGGSVAPALT